MMHTVEQLGENQGLTGVAARFAQNCTLRGFYRTVRPR